jgi:hypothetical protein
MNMKITINELRKIVRSVVSECYGWPVESEAPLYGVKGTVGKPSKHDPKNSALRVPKGRNSRMNESFTKISPREIAEWRKGNLGYIQENDEVTEGSCSECGGGMIEGECSECGAY